ncbi:hypothetical protein RUM43_012308 [Polyplax serrata]|uniref:Uncharacterized protein n=1 Tax=Polyplax serrata TaxID=468196 RepID=A0AAN8NS17_POLSC
MRYTLFTRIVQARSSEEEEEASFPGGQVGHQQKQRRNECDRVRPWEVTTSTKPPYQSRRQKKRCEEKEEKTDMQAEPEREEEKRTCKEQKRERRRQTDRQRERERK